MRLKKYSAERFAGACDVSVGLSDGLNVVLGSNESGKSTMIEGIFRLLTNSVYQKMSTEDGRSFTKKFFPSDGGNVIDGSLVFEDGGKEYVLSKTWVNGKKGQAVSLKETDGKKMTGEEAEAWLSELLKYGKGIYSSVIFGRQSNEAEILEWLYAFLDNDTDDGRGEAKNIISRALSAAGGVSIDKLSELLDEEIESRESNWDLSKNAPVKKGAKRNLGSIYLKYLDLSQKKEAAEIARSNIAELEGCRKKLSEIKERRAALRKSLDEYAAKRSEVETRAAKVEFAAKEAEQYENCRKTLAAWRQAEKDLSVARPLSLFQAEIENRRKYNELQRLIAEVKELSGEIEADEKEILPLDGISEDRENAVRLDRNISRNKLTLSAGELTAQIKTVNPHTAEIGHAEGSEKVSGTAKVRAKGFVSINIPDVAEIVVAPKNINIADIRAQIEADEKALSEILGRYQTDSVSGLETLQNKFIDKKRRIESNKLRLESKLDGRELSALENELARINISDEELPRDLAERKNAILSATGEQTLDDCVKGREVQIRTYSGQYGSIEALQAELEKHSGAKKLLEELEADSALSPEELREKIAGLDSELEDAQEEADELQRRLGSLENADDADPAELEDAVAAAEIAFDREKKECLLYKKIRADLNYLKENSEDNFSGFYDKLNGYLSEISGGRLSMTGKNAVQSGANLIAGKELLSEGTKKTVTLAFRLAVLDFFYPDGGGFIVLDDALIDMDPERRERSAALLKKFAENDQVVITTCDPAVAAMLSADVIKI